MKIISLKAENIKKLVAIEIMPDGNMVQITGKNGQGKTSIIDSIWWALAGAEHIQAQPIRQGAETATIQLDLGRLKVERRFTKKGNYLTVTNEEGARYPSPQTMLDELLGALSFDPLAFARMKPAEQFDMLRRTVKLDIDFAELDRLDKRDFEARTLVNRDAKVKRNVAHSVSVPDGLPAERIDEAPILTELQEVGTFNGEIENRKVRREAVAQQVAANTGQAGRNRDRAKQLRIEPDDRHAALSLRVREQRSADDQHHSRYGERRGEIRLDDAPTLAGHEV